MLILTRRDTSMLGQWWWTVDRWTLLSVTVLIFLGGVMVLAASPPVAERLRLDSFHFVQRHFLFLGPALLVMLAVSVMSPRGVRRIAAIGFVLSLLGMIAALLVGPEIKGATRWLSLGGISLQPSEFVKPCFAVVAAWMMAAEKTEDDVPGNLISAGLLLLVLAVLVQQPDLGMSVIVAAIWSLQIFVAGLSLAWVAVLAVLGVAGAVGAYLTIPHVASRIDRFFDKASGDSFQIDRAMDAFGAGGLTGVGPGDGIVKEILPDAHTDFIFAVAGEEFGVAACLLLLGLFAVVTLRGFVRLQQENNLFIALAVTGLLAQFGFQAIVNMGVNVDLLPTKGMTLPFVSYGGSSLMALALGMGMILSLTRDRPGGEGRA